MTVRAGICPSDGRGAEDTGNFVNAMAGAATQVSIVTTNGAAGRFGVTVSAFASVSAEPPLVLVCINSKNPAITAIEQNDSFCVNLLGQDQSPLADCFAGRPGIHRPYDFTSADWAAGATGAPVLLDATASFDCRVETVYTAGTHRIFIGRVALATASRRQPLAFSRRAYRALTDTLTTGPNL